MDDLKTSLEHLAGRVEDRPDAFVRLDRRRRVRTRTRRLTAGLLAVAIAVTGTLTAYSAFTTPSPRGPSTTPSPGAPAATTQPIAALWPEHDTVALRAAQEAVDSGEMRWRLDAEETAVRFVRSVLGWTSDDERLHHNAVEAPSGLVMVDVFTVPTSCEQESCDVVHDVILQLIRHGDEDGIWSVISAESAVFNMQFRIGQAVRVGEDPRGDLGSSVGHRDRCRREGLRAMLRLPRGDRRRPRPSCQRPHRGGRRRMRRLCLCSDTSTPGSSGRRPLRRTLPRTARSDRGGSRVHRAGDRFWADRRGSPTRGSMSGMATGGIGRLLRSGP